MSDDDLKKIGDLIDERLDKRLGPIEQQLNDPETGLKTLGSQVRKLNDMIMDPETGLKALNNKVEDVQAELSEVHKLSSSTYDLVKQEKQQRRKDINEIREQVGLPPEN